MFLYIKRANTFALAAEEHRRKTIYLTPRGRAIIETISEMIRG
ncbi:MAG: hypothetical protein ACT4OY_07065 [Alphaproteobacteria bacterium]